MPRVPINSLNEALLYIAELEDALKPFAPFAFAHAVPMEAELRGVTPEQVAAFKRDTAYCDMSMFYRAAELTRGT